VCLRTSASVMGFIDFVLGAGMLLTLPPPSIATDEGERGQGVVLARPSPK